jgi:hypothetical protein
LGRAAARDCTWLTTCYTGCSGVSGVVPASSTTALKRRASTMLKGAVSFSNIDEDLHRIKEGSYF